jgi:protein ImuB
VGIADGLFAARVAARRAVVVPPGGTVEFLARVPVSALAPDDGDADLPDLLTRLGLRTLGDLAVLPAGDVATRFGPQGVRAHRLARGQDERPLAPRHPPPDLVVEATLEPPAERVETAAFTAKMLADELHARLDELGLACTRVRIEAETEHGETLARVWRGDVVGGPGDAAGAFSAPAMAERVRWQLDGWLAGAARDRPTGGIALLRLVPDEVTGTPGRQLGFWGGDRRADERATRALARVQGILGHDAVVMPVLRGGRGPGERVAHLPPLGAEAVPAPATVSAAPSPAAEVFGPIRAGLVRPRPARSPAAVAAEAPWPGRLPAPSPALVHPAPLTAEVLDAEGAVVAVSPRGILTLEPARLWIAGGPWRAITAWAGPWPADERWWDPSASARRHRLQVVTGDGRAHLLALTGGQWWVEATYD